MLGTDPLKKATAEVTKLRKVRVDLEAKQQAAIAELAALKESLPAIALASVLGEMEDTSAQQDSGSTMPGLEAVRRLGAGTTAAHNRTLVLGYEIDACTHATRGVIPKLRDAISALNRAKASEIRKRADALSAELSGHRTKVEKLAEQLWSLEGVQYVPNWFPMGQHGIGGDGPIPFCATKTMRLTQERDALVAEANALENKQPQGAGLDATSLDELLAKVEALDLGTIPPTPAAVKAFFAEALQEAERDFERADYNSDFAPFGQLPRELNISMVFDANGEIQPGSRVTISLAPISRQLATERFGAEYAQPLSD